MAGCKQTTPCMCETFLVFGSHDGLLFSQTQTPMKYARMQKYARDAKRYKNKNMVQKYDTRKCKSRKQDGVDNVRWCRMVSTTT